MLQKFNASGVSCIPTLGGHGRYLIFLGVGVQQMAVVRPARSRSQGPPGQGAGAGVRAARATRVTGRKPHPRPSLRQPATRQTTVSLFYAHWFYFFIGFACPHGEPVSRSCLIRKWLPPAAIETYACSLLICGARPVCVSAIIFL